MENIEGTGGPWFSWKGLYWLTFYRFLEEGRRKVPGIFRNKLFTHQAITVTLIYHTKKNPTYCSMLRLVHESMCKKNLCLMYVFTVSKKVIFHGICIYAARHPNLQRRSARHRTGDMAWISAMLDQITIAGRNEPHFPTRSHQSAGTLEVKNEFFKNCHGCIVFFMQWCEVILNDNVDG